jgi:hypothetical protein
MVGECHGKASDCKAGEAKRRGLTRTGAERVLRLEYGSGEIGRGSMTCGVHPLAVQKRERVSWASRWIMG